MYDRVSAYDNSYPQHLQVLPEVFCNYPDIQAVYLFGSVATGTTHANSDIDLAVLSYTGTAKDQMFAIMEDLRHVGFSRVDVLFLETDNIALNYEAVRHNCLVYHTDDFDSEGTYARMMHRFRALGLERQDGVRKVVLQNRLGKLAEYMTNLYDLQQCTYETCMGDYRNYGSAERFLQLAIEVTLDIGRHIIKDLQWGMVEVASDVPTLFADHGYIDDALKQIWIQMVGFRNIVVHGYMHMDIGKVYTIVQEGVGDLERLKSVFESFLVETGDDQPATE